MIICGHYEGIDERVTEALVDEEISIGDFVLTGGEIAAMAVVDATCRLIPGVLKEDASHMVESFSEGLLEFPQYTRPPAFMGMEVPEILLSGHHENIEKWRRYESLKRTLEKKVVEYVRDNGILPLKGKKVLMTCAADRYYMTQGFVESGCDVVMGDLIFALDVPILIRNLNTFRIIASLAVPLISKLPFKILYPTGEKQKEINPDRYFAYLNGGRNALSTSS
jgi:hypothetical protein